jgi:hypothetical protein
VFLMHPGLEVLYLNTAICLMFFSEKELAEKPNLY